jgi:hypothetical protein
LRVAIAFDTSFCCCFRLSGVAVKVERPDLRPRALELKLLLPPLRYDVIGSSYSSSAEARGRGGAAVDEDAADFSLEFEVINFGFVAADEDDDDCTAASRATLGGSSSTSESSLLIPLAFALAAPAAAAAPPDFLVAAYLRSSSFASRFGRFQLRSYGSNAPAGGELEEEGEAEAPEPELALPMTGLATGILTFTCSLSTCFPLPSSAFSAACGSTASMVACAS